ncbi:MAG: hypothetical protein O3C43_10315 [Verrucomicrobia bacterium]|nr:hypothetical protein [Verrucomicrobiota bacterium]MDA1066887.1 hypothetical protein [Verrucomicrobiota bacterium]
MKKTISTGIFLFLSLAHTAMGHSANIVHMHPHGENGFLTTWMIAAAIGLAFGGRYLIQRICLK